MKLSIIIPVYNEEKTISEILKRIYSAKLPKGISKEVIVVDDCSVDKTAQILKRVRKEYLKILTQPKNMGKGSAVRLGIKNSTGEFILIQDADLEYNPNDYKKLLKPIIKDSERAVYGSRLINYPLVLWGKDKTPLPLHWIGNKFLTLVTNLIYHGNLTDMETCYKLIAKDIADKLDLKSNRFEIEPEVTAKILKRGIRIREVPIKVKPRTYKEGKKINWRDGFLAVWTLIKYRFIN